MVRNARVSHLRWMTRGVIARGRHRNRRRKLQVVRGQGLLTSQQGNTQSKSHHGSSFQNHIPVKTQLVATDDAHRCFRDPQHNQDNK